LRLPGWWLAEAFLQVLHLVPTGRNAPLIDASVARIYTALLEPLCLALSAVVAQRFMRLGGRQMMNTPG
jgi:hypothetical protein